VKAALRQQAARLRERLDRAENDRPPEPASCRWLKVLNILSANYRSTAEQARVGGNAEAAGLVGAWAADLEQAAALLREYVQAGKVGAHVESHANCKLIVMYAWLYAEPGSPWDGQPCPVEGEADALRQALQIDSWKDPAYLARLQREAREQSMKNEESVDATAGNANTDSQSSNLPVQPMRPVQPPPAPPRERRPDPRRYSWAARAISLGRGEEPPSDLPDPEANEP
jgi:hypothetical protein